MIYAIKIKVEVKDLHETEDLQSKIEQVRLIEKLGKQFQFLQKFFGCYL